MADGAADGPADYGRGELSTAIYDCVMFFNEVDLLYARLVELDPLVDQFVVVEATRTHQGASRNLVFPENRPTFERFLHKIRYVTVSDLPTVRNPSIQECLQRNAILRGLGDISNDDVVIISDLDEIPSRQAIAALPSLETGDILSLGMRFFYYGLNWELRHTWPLARVVAGSTLSLLTPHEVRLALQREIMPNAGWHFSYFYPRTELVERIREKAHAFLHVDLARPELLDERQLRLCVGGGLSWADEPRYISKFRFRTVDETFPIAVRDDKAGRFAPYAIAPGDRSLRLEGEAWLRHILARTWRPFGQHLARFPIARSAPARAA